MQQPGNKRRMTEDLTAKSFTILRDDEMGIEFTFSNEELPFAKPDIEVLCRFCGLTGTGNGKVNHQ